MTGFASYIYNGYFTAHADTLLSARVGNDITDELPILMSWFDELPKGNEEYTPTGLCQKIVMVTDRVCFIWAGLLSIARKFYRDVVQLLTDNLTLNNDGRKYLLDNYKSLDFEVIIYSWEDESHIVSTMIGCNVVDVSPFGKVVFGGSGQGAIYGVMSEFSYQKRPNHALEAYDKGEVTKDFSDQAVFRSIMDSVLQMRMLNGDFSRVHTGAGIDTILIKDGVFYKPQATLFLIFSDMAPDYIGKAPSAIVKRSYHAGYLGFSITDYVLREGRSVTIGHPGNIGTPFHFTPGTHDPFRGDVDAVQCIYLKEDGGISHFSESPAIFKDHFIFDYKRQVPLVSEWYIKDTELRRGKGSS